MVTADPVQPEMAPEPARPLDELVEAWFIESFYGIPDLPVHHFNRFRAAADRLKDRLAAAKE